MGGALLVCRVGLAGRISIAAVAKLLDRDGAREAVVGFGAPRRLAGPLAIVLPSSSSSRPVSCSSREASVGAESWPWRSSPPSRPRSGSPSRAGDPRLPLLRNVALQPAGRSALVRNAGLAAVAVFVVVGGWNNAGPSAIAWIGGLGATQLAAAVGITAALSLFAAVAWVVLQLMRSHGRMLARLERVETALAAAGVSLDEAEPDMPAIGHAPGTAAPDFALRDTLGVPVTRDSLLERGRPLLLLFTSPTCGPCAALMPMVTAWQREHEDVLTVVLVSVAARRPCEPKPHATDSSVCLWTSCSSCAGLRSQRDPSAVLVRQDARSRAGSPPGPTGSNGSSTTPSRTPPPTPRRPVCRSARWAATCAQRPGGRTRRAGRAARLGDHVALLEPGCGHCRAMHADLLAWEAGRPAGPPGSSSSPRATRGHRRGGIQVRVLFDDQFEVGPAFAAVGTPMAVRLDAEGRVASPLAAGAGAVFALADAIARPSPHRGDPRGSPQWMRTASTSSLSRWRGRCPGAARWACSASGWPRPRCRASPRPALARPANRRPARAAGPSAAIRTAAATTSAAAWARAATRAPSAARGSPASWARCAARRATSAATAPESASGLHLRQQGRVRWHVLPDRRVLRDAVPRRGHVRQALSPHA